MKLKSLHVALMGLTLAASGTAMACPKGTTLVGGTGPNHKGGKCVVVKNGKAVHTTAKTHHKAPAATTNPAANNATGAFKDASTKTNPAHGTTGKANPEPVNKLNRTSNPAANNAADAFKDGSTKTNTNIQPAANANPNPVNKLNSTSAPAANNGTDPFKDGSTKTDPAR